MHAVRSRVRGSEPLYSARPPVASLWLVRRYTPIARPVRSLRSHAGAAVGVCVCASAHSTRAILILSQYAKFLKPARAMHVGLISKTGRLCAPFSGVNTEPMNWCGACRGAVALKLRHSSAHPRSRSMTEIGLRSERV